jgi:hypothetical protein
VDPQDRERAVARLELLTVLATVPQKMPDLLRLYAQGFSEDDSLDQTTRKIADLFDCDLVTAAQVHDYQLRQLHPHHQALLGRAIGSLRTQLEET